MGKFLLSQSETDGDGLDHRQRVSQVRGGAPEGYAQLGGAQEIHVRPRRVLSLKARKSIADAQHLRWAKVHALQKRSPKRKEGSGGHAAAYWAKMSPLQRKREMARRGMVGKKAKRNPVKGAKAMKTYWAMMTPLQRSAEMRRRFKVRAGLLPGAKPNGAAAVA